MKPQEAISEELARLLDQFERDTEQLNPDDDSWTRRYEQLQAALLMRVPPKWCGVCVVLREEAVPSAKDRRVCGPCTEAACLVDYVATSL
ncbi:hypothetical protein QQY66_38870 [Streptomyces sp. DG2A-72]|uniref:hypothetical protein n=1 Tax=Streptomyces sp. DG2A-72 TaxID=3051386 RepID=UPI00265BFFB7|nr:hypothetical protein [Streptomyces sp. DG2A-72]MDO0937404.1 hypothetical protein [Streptomyces sp. DG2A-72]